MYVCRSRKSLTDNSEQRDALTCDIIYEIYHYSTSQTHLLHAAQLHVY